MAVTVTEKLTFETARRELEQIVERLERGETELEGAIRLWQRGEELHRFCLEQLDSAQGEIEELARRAEGVREPERGRALPDGPAPA